MDDFVRIFESAAGDVYHITLSEFNGILSEGVVGILKDVKVVGIELRRLAGANYTSQKVLSALEKTVADFFLKRDDVIICYYCDFINPIPRSTKNAMPPQEYRSRLFKRMFQRYSKQHNINNVRLSVIEINGINEKYYFHVIYRESHSMLASMIGSDLKEGYDK